ncbi:YraN family protein [Methylacidiphilum kamchatkense]|uniref:Putative endonuclease n=1 Tax=Methylacidiphilum kamchatkense Kam1 TaxID=1202785 RepID=A0A516TML9_9BACT|nr:YraN family protein [Methylacidiphilum kamchatkense]QDQ42487.1 putative endonuclease [Methylacidiphilum kamchatkense Kam1]
MGRIFLLPLLGLLPLKQDPLNAQLWVEKRAAKLAASFLRKIGFVILLRNITIEGYKLDLVCREKQSLVFVVVKSGYAATCEEWQMRIDQKEKSRLIAAAYGYLRLLKKASVPFRFDTVEILFLEKSFPKIMHTRNVFGREIYAKEL